MKTTRFKHVKLMGLAFVLGWIVPPPSQGCISSRDPRLNYFISYEKPHAGLFVDGAAIQDMHPTIIDKCQESSGKYLMIALALRTPKENGSTGDISFTQKLVDDSCRIVHNPFPDSPSYHEKLRVFEKQYQLLRTCTFYDIVEIDDHKIELPEAQPAARITTVGRNHIRVDGDFVYLKINRNSRFSIGIGLKKTCTQRETLATLGLEPGDLQALLNTYIAGEPDGKTADLTSLGSTRVRLALTSGSELMRVSFTSRGRVEPDEVPSWPTTFTTDVEFGRLAIKPLNDGRTKIDLVPLVENRGDRRCNAGICASENSFSAPVAGLVEITDLGNRRHKVIDSWYYGGSAPAQYQGFLEGPSRYLDPDLMSPGKTYRIEMTMVDPHEDFLLFRSGLSQMLIDLSSLGRIAGLDVMQALTGIRAANGMKPMNGLGGMIGPDASQIIDAARKEMDVYKGPQHWPPYFEKICTSRGRNCHSPGQVKFTKKIGAEFTLGAPGEDQNYRLEGLRIFNADPINGYQERADEEIPFVNCSGRGAPR